MKELKYPEDFVDKTIQGDCLEIMEKIPNESVDLVFVDPPYFLQLVSPLIRPNLVKKKFVRNLTELVKATNEFDNLFLENVSKAIESSGITDKYGDGLGDKIFKFIKDKINEGIKKEQLVAVVRGEFDKEFDKIVDAVKESWDKFKGFEEYDNFLEASLKECQRILKLTGTIWVIGTYHNIYRMGKIMQDLGYWFLNDVVWIKTNPLPHFAGVRFCNAHETLIWAKKNKKAKGYTFNYNLMKKMNKGKQMRSDWYFPLCSGKERVKDEHGKKLHSTQKPAALLERIILACTNEGDLILDPMAGTGTTGVIAKKLNRHFIMIEKEPKYVEATKERLKNLSEKNI